MDSSMNEGARRLEGNCNFNHDTRQLSDSWLKTETLDNLKGIVFVLSSRLQTVVNLGLLWYS